MNPADPAMTPPANEEGTLQKNQHPAIKEKSSTNGERPKTRERPGTRDRASNRTRGSNRNRPSTSERPSTKDGDKKPPKERPSTKERSSAHDGSSTKRITGTVKWFNVKDGYGFITRHDTGEDVFVHKTCIMRPNSRHVEKSIGDGEIVEFGLIASKVTGPGFTRVKGSPFVAPRRDRKGRPTSSQSTKEQVINKEPNAIGDGSASGTTETKAIGDGLSLKIFEQLNLGCENVNDATEFVHPNLPKGLIDEETQLGIKEIERLNFEEVANHDERQLEIQHIQFKECMLDPSNDTEPDELNFEMHLREVANQIIN